MRITSAVAGVAGGHMPFRQVLVIDELQGGVQLLRDAAVLAGTSGGHVRLMSRLDGGPGRQPDGVDQGPVLERLEHQAMLLRSRGVHVTSGVIPRSGLEAIAQEAVRASSDIVMKRRERRGRIASLVRRDDDRLLLRSCPCPVWLVDEETSPEGPVLAAVSSQEREGAASALDVRVLEDAAAVADGLGVRLHVVHAWSVPLMPVLGRVAVDPRRNLRAFEDGLVAAAARVERCTARSRLRVPRERIHLVRADPHVALPAVAESTRAQLLVVGEHPRHGLAAAVLGNVAEHLLPALRCSLLVVHSERSWRPARARARFSARLARLLSH
jgi:universal stress protein E